MPATDTMGAAEYVAALRENSEAYHRVQRTHEEFSARQRATWAAIENAGEPMAEAVLAILRAR